MEIISRKDAIEQGLTQYFTGKMCKHGHIAPRWVKGCVCTECTATKAKEWREENKEHRKEYRNKYREDNIDRERERQREYRERNKDRINEARHQHYLNNPTKYMLYRAKHRSAASGIEFNLTEADVSMPAVCPVFNTEFIVGDYDWAPSLDRIIPSKGYTVGNVIVVSAKANRIKNDATVDEIAKVLEYYSTII